jgi:hypothetical protein
MPWRWTVYVRRPWERTDSVILSLFDAPGGVVFSYLVIIKSMTHTHSYPPTDAGGFRDFYHNWTNSIFTTTEKKTADVLFRISWMTNSFKMYHLYLLFLVRLGGYIENLSDFYSYRLIGKLTVFLQLQEFNFRKPTVSSSNSAARISLPNSKAGLVWLSITRQLYVLRLI